MLTYNTVPSGKSLTGLTVIVEVPDPVTRLPVTGTCSTIDPSAYRWMVTLPVIVLTVSSNFNATS